MIPLGPSGFLQAQARASFARWSWLPRSTNIYHSLRTWRPRDKPGSRAHIPSALSTPRSLTSLNLSSHNTKISIFFLRGPGENSCPISSRNIICWFKIPLPPYPHSPEKISFCETKARNISWLFLTLPLTLRHPTKTKSRGPTACSYGERAWEKPVRISNVIQPPLINTFLLSFWSHKIFAVISCDFFLGKWY